MSWGSPETRFLRAYDVAPNGCWLWKNRLTSTGYGELRVHGRRIRAHRFAYELLAGPIPAGLTLDHLCRNRACVNPAHLEPVTLGENVLRGESPAAVNTRKTHCKYGHRFSHNNTRIAPEGWRVCRTCERHRCQRERLAGARA